jgi:hypothetical protein
MGRLVRLGGGTALDRRARRPGAHPRGRPTRPRGRSQNIRLRRCVRTVLECDRAGAAEPPAPCMGGRWTLIGLLYGPQHLFAAGRQPPRVASADAVGALGHEVVFGQGPQRL